MIHPAAYANGTAAGDSQIQRSRLHLQIKVVIAAACCVRQRRIRYGRRTSHVEEVNVVLIGGISDVCDCAVQKLETRDPVAVDTLFCSTADIQIVERRSGNTNQVNRGVGVEVVTCRKASVSTIEIYVPALVKFMFFSVMFDAMLMSAPRLVVFWIVPPVPSVVPVPLTVKLPLVLRSFMPLGAPLAETLVSDITSGVVLEARVISTAVARCCGDRRRLWP